MENEFKEHIYRIKEHLSIFDINFIIDHLQPKYHFEYFPGRGDDYKWYPDKRFEIVLDTGVLHFEEKTHISVSLPRKQMYYDSYVISLLKEYEVRREEPKNESEDNAFLKKLYTNAKNGLRASYNRDLHIKYLVWDVTKYLSRSQEEKTIIQSLANNLLTPTSYIGFSELDIEGMTFEILNFSNSYWNVRLKSTAGILGNYVHYRNNKPFIQDDNKVVNIPTYIHNNCHLYTMRIVEVAPGVFNNLTNIRKIIFSREMININWSFWNCRQLEEIEVEKYNYRYKSIDGVLFSADGKKLIAFPNANSSEYIVPEGVEIIEKFAFKDCDKLLKLTLPSSIKRIGINAFYRCTNLKSIVCDFPKSSVINEGFTGDHRMHHLQWIYKPLKFKTIIKL